jgi:hypothetical protein
LGALVKRDCAASRCRAATPFRSPRSQRALYALGSEMRPQLGSWLIQALPGLHWKVADGIDDGIDDGIAAQVVFGWPVSVIFYRTNSLILRCSLSKASNCRLDFSVPLTVLSLSDRARRPPPQESRSPIDDRVGMRGGKIPF